MNQFSYKQDVMNESNMFTLSLLNKMSWDCNKSIFIMHVIDNSANICVVDMISNDVTTKALCNVTEGGC